MLWVRVLRKIIPSVVLESDHPVEEVGHDEKQEDKYFFARPKGFGPNHADQHQPISNHHQEALSRKVAILK